MKSIEFEGKKYEIEDWVKYICRDNDGSINGFEEHPASAGGCWIIGYGRWVQLFSNPKRWDESMLVVSKALSNEISKDSKRFLEGRAAAYFGASKNDCPYRNESFPIAAKEWKAGWLDGFLEMNA